MSDGLIIGDDGLARCAWHGGDTQYFHYHDEEWGFPVHDDIKLFEKVSLEGFQAGLSWLTILRKREHFRSVFDGFDYHAVAAYGAADVERLLQDAGIIRHRGKIEAVINNASRAVEMEAEFGSLAAYFWSFEPAERGGIFDYEAAKAITQCVESVALSKDLKKRGWKFIGPTTMYAFMQAMGMVNDHLDGCHCRADIDTKRKAFVRP